MSETRIDVSPVCLHIIESKVPALILGKSPSFEIRDYSDQYEDWLLQEDGYELADGSRILPPQNYKPCDKINVKGEASHATGKPSQADAYA